MTDGRPARLAEHRDGLVAVDLECQRTPEGARELGEGEGLAERGGATDVATTQPVVLHLPAGRLEHGGPVEDQVVGSAVGVG